jgi:hypothetical protein
MKAIRFHSPVILAAALALVLAGPARSDESSSSVAFSDPSKPGTLKIRLPHGGVTIHGADVKEITVASEMAPVNSAPRKDGLRVLSASASYVLAEKGNVALLEYGTDGYGGAPADFEVTVPRDTSIVVANSTRGDIACTGVTGDIDIKTLSGDVSLHEVSGGALVETLNGDITVGVKSLAPSKPLSFSSMNGKITIRVPADTKAAVRFRTHRGVILTNFDDKALVTKTEISRRAPRREAKAHSADKDKDKAGAAAEEESPDRNMESRGSDDSGGDWHAEIRDSIREAADEAAMAAHEAAEAVHEGLSEARIEISGAIPPNAPIPPLPPMTGGKVVSGTLNGGGAEIQASTLNGDIVLKKAE